MVVYVILKKRFETTLMVVATTTTALVLAPLVAALVIPYVAHNNMLRALETCAIASLSSIAINYKNKGQQKPTKEASNGHPTC